MPGNNNTAQCVPQDKVDPDIAGVGVSFKHKSGANPVVYLYGRTKSVNPLRRLWLLSI
jgi:hypothetical protein